MTLTKSIIDKLEYSKDKGSQLIHWDRALPGFGVRVYPTGKKSFVLSYRHQGRQHIKVIGKYGVLTLDQAKDRARKHLASLIDRKDPFESTEGKTITFREFGAIYLERYAKQHKKTWREDQRRIEKYLVPAFGTCRLGAITRADVAHLHFSIGRDHPYAANRLVEQISKMFELAKTWGFLPDEHSNPSRGIKPYKEIKRDRWVKQDELPRLAAAITQETNFFGKTAIWLYLLLGVRRDELLRAKWEDVDWERQELRLPDTKSGTIHYVPISAPALAILLTLPKEENNPYLLPGEKRGHHLVNIQKIWNRIRKSAGVEDVRLHDLRRTLGSWLAQSGNSLHLIGKILNHKNPSTTAIYARFGQDNVREALEQHGQKLMRIAGEHAPGLMTDSNSDIVLPRSKSG